jgi:outer membrane protein assembly factor BamB
VPSLFGAGGVLRRAAFAVLMIASLLVATPAATAVGAHPHTAPTFNGGVYAITHRGSTVYVGGSFTSATWGGHTYPRLRLAAFDARTGELLSWAPAADGTVRALAATEDSVYAAGDFHAVGRKRRDSLARLDPHTGRAGSFEHALSGTPYALAVAHDRLYLGGDFSQVDGVKRSNLAAFALLDDRLDGHWRPAADATVHTIVAGRRAIYVGGSFHTVDEVPGTLRLAALDGTTGEVDPAFRPRPPAEVHALAVDRTSVYAATGGVGGRAIAYTTSGAPRWQRVFDRDAAAIAVAGGLVYVGGHFDNACLTERNGDHGGCTDGALPRVKLAAVTGTGALAPWAPQANGVIGVRVLSVNRASGRLEAGGDFTTVGGLDQRRFASF